MPFIEVHDDKTGEPMLVNLRHVNIVEVGETTLPGGAKHRYTLLGINNYGASGCRVSETYERVAGMIRGSGE